MAYLIMALLPAVVFASLRLRCADFVDAACQECKKRDLELRWAATSGRQVGVHVRTPFLASFMVW